MLSVIRRVPHLPMAQVLDLKMSKSSCQIPSEAPSLQLPSLWRRHKPTEFPPMLGYHRSPDSASNSTGPLEVTLLASKLERVMEQRGPTGKVTNPSLSRAYGPVDSQRSPDKASMFSNLCWQPLA